MQSASSVTAARKPQTIDWRLALWWMGANAAGVAVIALREFQYYRFASTSGFHAPAQLWASEATNLFFILLVGAAQALTCSWAFSYIAIRDKTLRGASEAALGFVSGFVFALLGVLLTDARDVALGAWIFAPTGIVFGWLVATSQSEWFPQTQITGTKGEKRAAIATKVWRFFQQGKLNCRLVRWWMALNTAGVTVAVVLAQWEAGFLPRGALLFLAFLAILGVLQALICSGLVSFVRMGNKIMRSAAGVALGFATAILVMFAGAFFISYYVVVGFWVFVPSGILFGWLLAAEQPARGVRPT